MDNLLLAYDLKRLASAENQYGIQINITHQAGRGDVEFRSSHDFLVRCCNVQEIDCDAIHLRGMSDYKLMQDTAPESLGEMWFTSESNMDAYVSIMQAALQEFVASGWIGGDDTYSTPVPLAPPVYGNNIRLFKSGSNSIEYQLEHF